MSRLRLPSILLALGLAGCGGSHAATASHPTGPSVAPVGGGSVTVTRVAGTSDSAQDVATAAAGTPGAFGPRSEVQPLPVKAFRRPVARWRVYAAGQASASHAAATALAADLAAGDRAAGKQDWQRSYDHFVRIGAAYGALGELGTAIGGRPGAFPGGVHDPHFTGLHRIERVLFGGGSLASLRGPAQRLVADTGRLRHRVRHMAVEPLDYATRAHEILEDAQRDQLSGTEAPWSHAGLRTTADAVVATRVVLGTLRPLLQGRGDALPPVEARLGSLEAELAAIRRSHGGTLPALGELSRPAREQVQGRVGAALEALSGLPGALETTLPPVIPAIPKAK